MDSLVKLVRGWGGRRECSIPVYGGRVPAILAALINSTMARARDFDDVYEPAGIHIGATIVPCTLVVSEYSKVIRKVAIAGKEFIVAHALGSDFLARLRLAGPGGLKEGGWASETPAPLAVALMGGKLLGFDDEKTLNAMGIAYAQCSGNLQAHAEGVSVVRLQQGLSAMSGILGIMLAEQGFTGPKDMLEGQFGYYILYMHGEYQPRVLTRDLGKRLKRLM